MLQILEMLPDEFTGNYTVPILPGTDFIPVGYQPAIMRAKAAGARIPAQVGFRRLTPGDRRGPSDASVTFLDGKTIRAFEFNGRYLDLPKPSTGLELATRPSAVVEGISVTAVNAVLEGGDIFGIDDTTMLRDPNLSISVTWADIIAEGAGKTIEKAWIMFSSNSEGL